MTTKSASSRSNGWEDSLTIAKRDYAGFIAREIRHLLYGAAGGPTMETRMKKEPPRPLNAVDICLLAFTRNEAKPIVEELIEARIPFSFYKQTGLWNSEEAEQIVSGAPVQIVGWGQQTSDAQPPAGTVGVKFIADSVIGEIAPYELQIGDSPDDGRKCHGDSGGPTYFEVEGGEDPDPWRVIGVTSHSFDFTDCASRGGVGASRGQT